MANLTWVGQDYYCPQDPSKNRQRGWYYGGQYTGIADYVNPATGKAYTIQDFSGGSTPTQPGVAQPSVQPVQQASQSAVNWPYQNTTYTHTSQLPVDQYGYNQAQIANMTPEMYVGIYGGTLAQAQQAISNAAGWSQLISPIGGGQQPNFNVPAAQPAGGDMTPYFQAGEMLTAPMSKYEQEALDMMQQLIQGIISGEPIGHDPTQTPLGQQVESTLMSLLSGEFPEEYFQTSIADPTRYAFEEEVRPAIKESYAGPGTYWSGARAEEEAKKHSEMEMGLAAIRGELGHQARQLALQAIGPANEFLKLPMEQQIAQLASVGTYMEAAALPRLIKQHALDIAYQEFIRTRPENQPYLQAMLSMLGIPMMGTYGVEEQPGPGAQVGNLIGSIFPLILQKAFGL
jgi:hypothetical protein